MRNKESTVLLLNPPGKKRYSRDYFCSKTLKGCYSEQPIDLVMLSGLLRNAYRVVVLDCITEKLQAPAAFKRIILEAPQAIIFLTSSLSWQEDSKFLVELKSKLTSDCIFLGIGDLLLGKQAEYFLNEAAWLDGALFDFTDPSIIDFLKGKSNKIEKGVIRNNHKFQAGCINNKKDPKLQFTVGIPQHEKFPLQNYSFPFARRLPVASVLSDYGCPFSCPFCINGTIGYKTRELSEFFEEIYYLNKLGISEIFIRDQSFGFPHQRCLEICHQLAKVKPPLSWTCFSRADLVDEELIVAMHRAGCHSIIFGVESGCQSILDKYKPGLTKERIRETFKVCKRIGIETIATFVLGFPEEDLNEIQQTIAFAVQIKADYASFNLLVPKIGTSFEENVKPEIIQSSSLDQSGSKPVLGTNKLSPEQLWSVQKNAIRKFYLRPKYLFQRFRSISSRTQFKIMLQNSFSILTNLVTKKD